MNTTQPFLLYYIKIPKWIFSFLNPTRGIVEILFPNEMRVNNNHLKKRWFVSRAP